MIYAVQHIERLPRNERGIYVQTPGRKEVADGGEQDKGNGEAKDENYVVNVFPNIIFWVRVAVRCCNKASCRSSVTCTGAFRMQKGSTYVALAKY